MTADTRQLSISLSRPDGGDLVDLARRCSTTRQALALLAVRQLLAAHQGRGKAPSVLPLDQAEDALDGIGVTATLQEPDAAALDELAARLGTSPEKLGRLAILNMLAAASAGAVPMAKAMEAPPLEQHEPASAGAARMNFTKAKLIVDRLHHISEFGFDDASRAALADLEILKTIPPF